MNSRRALHYVFKVENREKTIQFYKEILDMKILRHEEFEESCKAFCNGPYDGRWSKTMVGYGPEDNHFVIELTYNYGIDKYPMGNDFQSITIQKEGILANSLAAGITVVHLSPGLFRVVSPDGHAFMIADKPTDGLDPIKEVAISVSVLKHSLDFWHNVLGMSVLEQSAENTVLAYTPTQCHLRLVTQNSQIERAKAYGRIAFACPENELTALQSKIESIGGVVLKSLVTLETEGKASVQVVIIADPDNHEICFVGDKGFRELSQLDTESEAALNLAIELDRSNEWFLKKGKSKESA